MTSPLGWYCLLNAFKSLKMSEHALNYRNTFDFCREETLRYSICCQVYTVGHSWIKSWKTVCYGWGGGDRPLYLSIEPEPLNCEPGHHSLAPPQLSWGVCLLVVWTHNIIGIIRNGSIIIILILETGAQVPPSLGRETRRLTLRRTLDLPHTTPSFRHPLPYLYLMFTL